MSGKSSRRAALQRAMRAVPPEDKHINTLLELSGPLGGSPEHDRVAAIIAATYLEYGLKKAIKKHLKPDSIDPDYNYLFAQDDAPYRDFAALNRLARAFGILIPANYENLETIRHVRNAFAHGMDHSMTFDSPGVSEAIDSLVRPDVEWFSALIAVTMGNETFVEKVMGRRRVFLTAAFSHYWSLILYHPRGPAGPLLDFLRS